jgi:capsular polysaccharide biosynthesis protein/MinD-like ATPase involved in chromosome partitioning or flagellar assembly
MRQRTTTTWGPRDIGDEPVDVPRYLTALRRSWPLIALIILLMTATVLVLSLALPKTYQATSRILMEDQAGVLQAADADSVTRRLATVQTLLTTRNVLAEAAERLPDESAQTLEDKVEVSVDQNANIVDVVATDGDPEGAAAIANAVARSFLALQQTQERERLARARADLEAALAGLRGTPGSETAVQAIQERLSDVSVSEASAGSGLELAQAAQPPSEPDSPRPVRNTIFAFFAAAFVAVLAALALDQLAPRLSGPRELSRLTGVPVLAALPPRRRRRKAQTEEAYQALQASLLQLPATRKLVLVTSASTSEEKSAVTLRLAESLASAGSRTLLVSADLRRPRIERLLGLGHAPGLVDVLQALGERGGEAGSELLRESVVRVSPHLHVLPAGNAASNSAHLLAGEPLAALFDGLERSYYRYVLVDGSPLLGVVDGPLLARCAEAALVVCRLDRMTPAAAAELGDVLERLRVPVQGLVAIGVRRDASYSVGVPSRALEEPRSTVEVS